MRWLLVAILAACSDKSPPRADPPPPAPKPAPAGRDAGMIVQAPSGMHLDDDVAHRPAEPGPAPARGGRPIDVTLRSSPSGAQAAVDGVVIGPTPTFWAGQADGHEHEFTFQLPGYALARYRFVPVASGVVHGRLEPITEEPDAGAPTPEVVPEPSAGSVLVNPPPAPILPKADATPVVTPDAAPSGLGPQP